MLDWIGGIWKGLMERVGIIWKELKALAEWVFVTMMWADEYVYERSLWLIEWYSNNTKRLTELTWNGMEWIRDQIEWLVGVSKENATRLVENA